MLSKYELRDVSTGVSASGDLAWMTFKGYFEQTMQGIPGRVETAETLQFRNENGNWRMFRAHASVRDPDAKQAASKTPSPDMILMSGRAPRMSFQSLPVFWPVMEPM